MDSLWWPANIRNKKLDIFFQYFCKVYINKEYNNEATTLSTIAYVLT